MKTLLSMTVCSMVAVMVSGMAFPNFNYQKNPCAEHRDRLQNGQGGTPPGMFVPQCTANGWYNYKQCHGSSGYCWCAFPTNGQELPNTKVPPSSNRALQCPKCLVEQAKSLPPAGMVGRYSPQCDAQGNYQPQQFHGSTGYRWCVDRVTGQEAPGTKTPPGVQKRLPCD